MRGARKAAIVLATLLVAPELAAQASAPPGSVFGGPQGVSGELAENERAKEDAGVAAGAPWLDRWYDWKKQLEEDHGFTLGVNAYLLYQGAAQALDEDVDDAFGGIYRVQGKWTLTGRGSANPGRLEWRIENRSKSFTDFGPSSLSKAQGIATLDTGFGYSDRFDTDLAVINWTQFFAEGRAAVAAGRLAFDAYLDAFPFQTFSRGFLNRSFLVNPTLGTTGVGAIGVVAKGFVTDQLWVGAQAHDGNAASGDFDWETVEEGEWLTAFEAGWAPSIADRNRTRFQFTAWHKDARERAGVDAGRGWAISATHTLDGGWQPFVRLGHSDGGAGVAATNALSTGVEWTHAPNRHLSFGLGWAEPTERADGTQPRDEYVAEVSYRMQLSRTLSLMPDLQYVKDPAQNPDEDAIWVAGLRAIVAF